MVKDSTSQIEFSFKETFHKIGTIDNTSIIINLDTNPNIGNIIGNFYYFLVKIGVKKELLNNFIKVKSRESDEDLDESDIDFDDYTDDDFMEEELEDNSYEDFLKDFSKDNNIDLSEKNLEKFLQQMQDNKNFLKQVFEIFIESI